MAITRTRTNRRVRRASRGCQWSLAPRRSKRTRVSFWSKGSIAWLSVVCTLSAPAASGQTWHFAPSIAVDETLTSNASLTGSSESKPDLVTTFTPGFSILEKGARTSLSGSVSVPILLYVRTGSDNDRAYPTVNIVGNVEAIEKLFYIDGAVTVSQQYLSPFGSRPSSLTTVSANRYTAETYTLTPYFKGVMQGNLNYELRDANIWTNSSQTEFATNNSYTNDGIARLSKDPAPWGWSIEADRTNVKFPQQPALVTQLERFRLIEQIDPQLQAFGGAGYEDDHYIFADFKDVTYNLGVHWRPTDRTRVDADWEHRFFGASYHFSFDHRTPLSVWSVQASRDVTTYPQQLAGLPAGLDVATYLNQLFLTSIPDPVQRAAFVAQLIQNGGLPLFLSGGVNLYTQQATIEQSASASMGLLGARNSIFFSIFRLRSESVAAATGPAPGVNALNNNTQSGGSITWTHNVTPSLSLNTEADYSRTVAIPPAVGKTNQGAVRATFTTPIATNTTAYAGARYQQLHSDVSPSYHEYAIFVGLTHIFH
jgi:uncharacterized protein (PEP-CTERM system associated)